MKKKQYVVFILIVIFIAVTFYSCRKVVTYLKTVETAENIKSINELPNWLNYLPASAKNISYWKLPMFCTTYEYEVAENDFLKWAEENEILLTEIKDSSEIVRYLHHFTSYPDTDDSNELSEYYSKRTAIVHKGYEYHRVQDNGGGSHIVYDSEKQKAESGWR